MPKIKAIAVKRPVIKTTSDSSEIRLAGIFPCSVVFIVRGGYEQMGEDTKSLVDGLDEILLSWGLGAE